MSNDDGMTVSVVVPLYNGRPYVEQALRSVVDQTVQPREVIVVDDGSTDGSPELVETLDAPVPVKVVRQANRGQSAARNLGVGLASGELIAFVDQDDEWRRNHLEALMRAISKKPDIGWAYTDFDEMDSEGRTVTHSFMREHRLVHPKTSLAACLAGDLMVLPSASLIRKAALDDVGGFDERLAGYEDDDLFVRMFRADWKHVFVPKPLTRFRIHADGTNSSSAGGFLDSRMIFLDKLIESVADDDRLNRYWVRDLVLPRFFVTTVDDYARALSRSRWEEAARTAEAASRLADMMQPRLRRRMEVALMLRPKLCRRALQGLDRLPRRAQRLVNPALRLRFPSAYKRSVGGRRLAPEP
jgi:glycosyltransferase involved in cell wall biosynthesis